MHPSESSTHLPSSVTFINNWYSCTVGLLFFLIHFLIFIYFASQTFSLMFCSFSAGFFFQFSNHWSTSAISFPAGLTSPAAQTNLPTSVHAPRLLPLCSVLSMSFLFTWSRSLKDLERVNRNPYPRFISAKSPLSLLYCNKNTPILSNLSLSLQIVGPGSCLVNAPSQGQL